MTDNKTCKKKKMVDSFSMCFSIDTISQMIQDEQKLKGFVLTEEAKQTISQQIMFAINGILDNMQSLCESSKTDKANLDTFYHAFNLKFQQKHLGKQEQEQEQSIPDPLFRYIEFMFRKRLERYYTQIQKLDCAPNNKIVHTMKAFFNDQPPKN